MMKHQTEIAGATYACDGEAKGVFKLYQGAYVTIRTGTPVFRDSSHFRAYVARMLRDRAAREGK